MRQNLESRTRFAAPDIGWLRHWAPRLWPAALFFAIAFVIDMATGQRYSSVWGSMAIVGSLVAVFPRVRPTLAAFGAFAGVWVAFNLVRAVADNLPLALAGEHAVASFERRLFGGQLPSTWMQTRWFDRDAIGMHDVLLSIVHGSFFVVPFVVAIIVWWKHRSLFRPLLISTAIAFAIGLVGFILLPTVPPWIEQTDDVMRIAHVVLADRTGLTLSSESDDMGYWFEPNALAAMPSVHVAATVLVFLVLRRINRVAGAIGAIYALAMTVGVVYLGEHYVLDALAGWAVALAGWWIARPRRAEPTSPAR